jgi:U3 small nucleolar RNA-associated protein 7
MSGNKIKVPSARKNKTVLSYRGSEGDPDGSLRIARGLTQQESKELGVQILLGRSDNDKQRIQHFLEGPHSHHAKERSKLLKHDDANMKMDSLREPQKRALQKRRQRPNKAVEAHLDRRDYLRLEAAVAAADAQLVLQTDAPGIVEAENDMERTTRLSQMELKNKHLSEQTAHHIYDLNLESYAPYGLKYDRSGRYSVLYGQGGHVAVMDCHARSLEIEFHLPQERVRDVSFLHNNTLVAVAQKNHAYIYDNTGAEIHRLSDHIDPMVLDFLPYHWLLVSVGRAGWLKYHDTSTGELVSAHRTKVGCCNVMRQNPTNAVIHCGHHNGTVTLWSPASSQYLVKMLCHKGSPVTSLAVRNHTLVTGGADRQVKIWDLRMFKEIHAYYTVAGIPTSLDISQRGVLGIGHAGHATFWKPSALQAKEKDPYMHHEMPGCSPVETVRFRPFEDVCGIGHSKGISSIVIPGSGEPNLDTSEYHTNPYQDTKQRREAEVRSLLDKLSPNMISLDPDVVGTIEASDPHLRRERIQDIAEEANSKVILRKKKQKTKKRGRSKIQTQLRRKARNVVDESTIKLRESRERELAEKMQNNGSSAKNKKDNVPLALKRFFE